MKPGKSFKENAPFGIHSPPGVSVCTYRHHSPHYFRLTLIRCDRHWEFTWSDSLRFTRVEEGLRNALHKRVQEEL